MKKLIYLAAAAALLGMASCGNAEKKADNGLDSIYSQQKVDSLFFLIAETQGMSRGADLQMDSTINKDQFLKGFYYGMAADTAASYFLGVREGIMCSEWLKNFTNKGINVNRRAFVKEYAKGLLSDSISEQDLQNRQTDIQTRYRELESALALYEEAKLEASEVSQNNIKAGIAYLDSVAKADATVKIAANGVGVKVDSVGAGEKVGNNERIFITGTVNTPDGREIDSYNNRMIFVGTQVSGLVDVIKDMNVGETATIYVPGKLAFGVKRNRFNLTPNQMLIYHLTIDGIYKPEN